MGKTLVPLGISDIGGLEFIEAPVGRQVVGIFVGSCDRTKTASTVTPSEIMMAG
jgi:hypothetical protein